MFQVSSRSQRINLHLVTVMNCSAPGSPLTPVGFLPLQQDSPGAQPGPPVPVHIHFNGTSRPRASCAHRADKHSHQAQHPQSNRCGNCCYNTEMKGQREDEQNPKTDPVSPALGSPRKGCQGTYRSCGLCVVPRSYRQVST